MTTQIDFVQEQEAPHSALRRLIWVTPLAMLGATVASLGLYTVAGRLFSDVAAWPGAGIEQIVGANIIYLLIGAIAFALVARFSSQPARHYVIVASVGLLFSLFLPISAGFGYGAPGTPPADAATVITLSLMHIVTFAISVPLFIHLVLDQRR